MKQENVELEIGFKGESAGMNAGRLSLGSFSAPMDQLLIAFRRQADAVSRSRPNGANGLETKRGAFGPFGKNADLQLDLDRPSNHDLVLKFDCVFNHQDASKPSVPVETVSRLLELIERESTGHGRHSHSVRRFIATLPMGISEQSYAGRVNGAVIRSFKLPSPDFQVRRKVPLLVEIKGRIAGLGLDDHKETIRIRQQSGALHTCHCDRAMTEAAYTLRDVAVVAKILVKETEKTLLDVRPVHVPDFALESPEREKFLLQKWSGVLRRLAE